MIDVVVVDVVDAEVVDETIDADDIDLDQSGDDEQPPYVPPAPPGDPGDECQSCAPFFAQHGEPPRKLVLIPNKFTDFGIPIIVCPFCDGQPILTNNGLNQDGNPVEDVG